MLRAISKGAGLFIIGGIPGGPRTYRRVTREYLGTQHGHVLKLQRIWPDIVEVFRQTQGDTLEGKVVLAQENGYSPFIACVNFLTCGNGGVLLNTRNSHARVLEMYTTESINRALEIADVLSGMTPIPPERIRLLDGLRWRRDFTELLDRTGTRLIEGVACREIPLEPRSIDMVFSGGALEHYRPEDLRSWTVEASRVLRPGGITEVILDHRDHLHHHDAALPFLSHYGIGDRVYRFTHHNPLLFHNRLTPPELSIMLEQAGMERARLLRRALPSDTWFEEDRPVEALEGIRRERLSPRFRSLTDTDLRTAAAMYVYRKPLPADATGP